MLWFLRLLGAPSDPAENMAWQYGHPARVAFAFAFLLSGFFSAFLLATTQKASIAVDFFVAFFVFSFVLAYVAVRVRRRSHPHGDAAAGGTA